MYVIKVLKKYVLTVTSLRSSMAVNNQQILHFDVLWSELKKQLIESNIIMVKILNKILALSDKL